MSAEELRKTPFYQKHLDTSGKMVDFAGWLMPIQYKGIKAEHLHVREHVGLFDVSHMGRVEVTGTGSLSAIQSWICNDAASLQDGESLYSPICNEKGGIVDDCLVYRREEHSYIIVVNGSNREKDHQWFLSHIPKASEGNVDITHPDDGDKWGLLALQGPKARTLLQALTTTSLMELKHNQFCAASLAGIADCIVACTGYTGEDGFEIFVPTASSEALWDALFEEGKDELMACGLGARDTLRLEMKYPLYGNDIDDTTSPVEAGLKWTVSPTKGDFLGRETILKHYEGKPPRRLIGFQLEERGVARHGYKLFDQEGQEEVGTVTSGGFSPSLGTSIGLGYVPAKPQFAKPGSPLTIDIRGKKIPVRVVKTPFVKK